jgi:hypothetical protein
MIHRSICDLTTIYFGAVSVQQTTIPIHVTLLRWMTTRELQHRHPFSRIYTRRSRSWVEEQWWTREI